MIERRRNNVSTYCDYNDTFISYDQLRRPNGIKELLQIFRQSHVPLEEQIILEGGFGTGAYIDLLRHHVKEIHGVEGSDEGLKQASQKMTGATNVYLQLGNILHLTYANASFDAYMVNQVLHHLDTDPAYPNLNVFLAESRRVLKPGGVLTINTSSQDQLDPRNGVFWNYKYIENAVRAIQARHIPIEMLISRLQKYQFTDIRTTTPSEKIFHPRYYDDPTFALESIFQKGDSVYCFMTPRDLEKADAYLRSELKNGSVYKEMKRAEERVAEIGEGVILSARTPW